MLRIHCQCALRSHVSRPWLGLRKYASQAAAGQVQDLDPTYIRNMAVVAHIGSQPSVSTFSAPLTTVDQEDSGKTTLTESILLASSYIDAPGSVDSGSTITDFLPAERARGITIQSASIPVHWREWTFNLIDTPGHSDFGMEVESASRVVDGAIVVIDSVQGVEPQTKGVWSQLDRYGVQSRILFMNKLDRAGASLHSSFLSLLSHRLHPRPIILTLPIASFNGADYQNGEPGVVGLVDLLHWELWSWEGAESSRRPLPRTYKELEQEAPFSPNHPLIKHIIPARVALFESLSMLSEDVMGQLLALPDISSWTNISADTLIPELRRLTLAGEILPVLCGAAAMHLGTEVLMDYAGKLLASPLDKSFTSLNTSEQVEILAWKVAWDKRRGWLTFVRVYSGTLRPRLPLLNTTRNERERPSKLLLLYANRETEIGSLPAGSVGVILGLKITRTGDTLCSPSAANKRTLPDITPPAAFLASSLTPVSHSEEKLLHEAVHALTRTDPSVKVEVNEGQLLIHTLGPLHLEIVTDRLRDEWEAQFEMGPRRVSFREGVDTNAELDVKDSWRIDANGVSHDVGVHLSIASSQQDARMVNIDWEGNLVSYQDEPLQPPGTKGIIHFGIETALSQGIHSVLLNSPNSSLPFTGLLIKIHAVDLPPGAPPTCAMGAVAHILRRALQDAGLGPLLEPYVQLKIDVDEHHIGPVIKDITEHGGEIQDFERQEFSTGPADATPFSPEGLYVPEEFLTPCSGSSNAANSAIVKSRRHIHAVAPLAKVLDFSHRLKAMTGGHGLFESFNIGYRIVAQQRAQEILKEIGRA